MLQKRPNLVPKAPKASVALPANRPKGCKTYHRLNDGIAQGGSDLGGSLIWGVRFGPAPRNRRNGPSIGGQTNIATVQGSTNNVDNLKTLRDCQPRPQPAQAGPDGGDKGFSLEYTPASELLMSTKGGRVQRNATASFARDLLQVNVHKPPTVPGEGVLRLEEMRPTPPSTEPILGRNLKDERPRQDNKQDNKPRNHRNPPRSSHTPSVGRPSQPPGGPARPKPRHSGDSVVAQNTHHKPRPTIIALRSADLRYLLSLRLPPISAPQRGPLPPISSLTGVFKYCPRRSPLPPPLPRALHVSAAIDAGGETIDKPIPESPAHEESRVEGPDRISTSQAEHPQAPQLPPRPVLSQAPHASTEHADDHVQVARSAVPPDLPILRTTYHSRDLAALSLATPTEHLEHRWHAQRAQRSRTSVRWHPYHTPRLGRRPTKVHFPRDQ